MKRTGQQRELMRRSDRALRHMSRSQLAPAYTKITRTVARGGRSEGLVAKAQRLGTSLKAALQSALRYTENELPIPLAPGSSIDGADGAKYSVGVDGALVRGDRIRGAGRAKRANAIKNKPPRGRLSHAERARAAERAKAKGATRIEEKLRASELKRLARSLARQRAEAAGKRGGSA